MKKSKKSLKKELLEVGATKLELDALLDMAEKFDSTLPTISKKRKRQLVSEIVGSRVIDWQRVAVGFSGAFAATLIIFLPVVNASLPGDTLYSLKRGMEDTRAKVQHSYDDTLVQKREAEVETLKTNGAAEDVIQKAQEEKSKVEQRRDSRRSGKKSNSGNSNFDNNSRRTNADDDINHSSNSGGGQRPSNSGNSGQSGSGNSGSGNSGSDSDDDSHSDDN